MAQVKIYGRREFLTLKRQAISDAIHQTIVEVLKFPQEKRYHRFIGLAAEDYLVPSDKSPDYLIIEIQLMTGRSTATRKTLIKTLFAALSSALGIRVTDLEIVLFESPPENWGFRGITGDEAVLNYSITV
ncbi:tautomerase [Planctomycetota bacterium]|nr:tautomerase [Planctomycetota bacterium]